MYLTIPSCFSQRLERHLRPTLTGAVVARLAESHVQRGAWFTTGAPSKSLGVTAVTRMHPAQFSRLRVNLLFGDALNVCLR
jgi:hypothetical protein